MWIKRRFPFFTLALVSNLAGSGLFLWFQPGHENRLLLAEWK